MKTLLYLLPVVAIGFVIYCVLLFTGTINFPEEKRMSSEKQIYAKIRNMSIKNSAPEKEFIHAVYLTKK